MIHPGTQERIIRETTLGAGTTSQIGVIQTDALLCSLWVDSVTSGTLDISVYTLTDNGKEVLLFSFPQISAPTGDLLLKKSGVSLSQFKVVATYTGVCSYEIYVRAINGSGESNVRMLGSSSLLTSSETVTTTPGVLIASALTDRNGISFLNYSGVGTLFVSEDISKLTSEAWPIPPGGGWSLDVAAGVTLYAVSTSGNIDVRIAQSGG